MSRDKIAFIETYRLLLFSSLQRCLALLNSNSILSGVQMRKINAFIFLFSSECISIALVYLWLTSQTSTILVLSISFAWNMEHSKCNILKNNQLLTNTLPYYFSFSWIFFNGPTLASSCLFLFFFKHNFFRKTVGFNRIRTRIIGLEGKNTDHLTTPNFIWL